MFFRDEYMKSNDENKHNSGNVIWSHKPAGEWAEGYPTGNGRIGAMVLGSALQERVGLNHDLLWRRFWTYQEHYTASDISEIRRLCAEGKWDEAQDLILQKIPFTGNALYLNPFVPVGDLGIHPFHGENEISEYKRWLDMGTGITGVEYSVNDVRYRREYFCSWPAGALVIRLSSSRAGMISGEVTLSRLLDPDCIVTGSSKLGEITLRGEFEEGVNFAAVVRVIQRGGRLTGGRSVYQPSAGEIPAKDLSGLKFIFRGKEESTGSTGASTCFDSADKVLLLISISTDDESKNDLVECCRKKLDKISSDFEKLRIEHVQDHQRLYGRVGIRLGDSSNDVPTDELVYRACDTNSLSPLLHEQLFNMGRYLAIASGRPQAVGQPAKAPINLQGIWNQDRRPAWDCDYHMDLNLEMCYWPLELVNLGDLVPPLMDWVESLIDQGRTAAMDLYGCHGILMGVVNDYRNIGNFDNLGFCWTGAAAWVAQILWQHWEYSRDADFLRNRLYPFLKEIARFYEDFLTEDNQGRLLPCPSGSPEMGIKGRKQWSLLSSPSTIDLELIREVFTHLLDAGAITGLDESKRENWLVILQKLSLPVIDKDGALCEWLEEHEPGDPGHRHRSHLIGICPGDRITMEETPDYHEGARKALDKRHKYGQGSSLSFSTVWDAQIYARLYDAQEALRQVDLTIKNNVMDNLLMVICDWRDRGTGLNWFLDKKVFQVEASIGIVAAIAEMVFQDRRGLLRLLPALPHEWPEGSVRGLRGRGGFEVDIEWKNNRLVESRIKSLYGNRCRVKAFNTDGVLKVVCRDKGIQSDFSHAGIMEFNTEKGEIYVLTLK